MIPAALSAQAKPTPGKRVIWYKSKDGHSVPVTWKESRDPQPGEMDEIASQVESRLATGWRPASSQPERQAPKYSDPVALYKQSIGQVPPSSVMTGAAAGLGGARPQPKRMDLSVLAGGVPTGGVMGPAPIQSRTPNEARATENIKWSNDVQARTRTAIEDNPVSTFLAGLDPTDVLIPSWKKGLAGHILGGISGVANIPANVAGNVQMVYDPNATPEQQLKALGSVGFDLAGGALIGPAGKLVKKGALTVAGATKAGRAVAVNAAMKETAKSGIKPTAGQAISALVKAGVPKAEAVQAVKAAELERVNNPPMSVKTGEFRPPPNQVESAPLSPSRNAGDSQLGGRHQQAFEEMQSALSETGGDNFTMQGPVRTTASSQSKYASAYGKYRFYTHLMSGTSAEDAWSLAKSEVLEANKAHNSRYPKHTQNQVFVETGLDELRNEYQRVARKGAYAQNPFNPEAGVDLANVGGERGSGTGVNSNGGVGGVSDRGTNPARKPYTRTADDLRAGRSTEAGAGLPSSVEYAIPRVKTKQEVVGSVVPEGAKISFGDGVLTVSEGKGSVNHRFSISPDGQVYYLGSKKWVKTASMRAAAEVPAKPPVWANDLLSATGKGELAESAVEGWRPVAMMKGEEWASQVDANQFAKKARARFGDSNVRVVSNPSNPLYRRVEVRLGDTNFVAATQVPKPTIPVPKYNPADMAPKRFPDQIGTEKAPVKESFTTPVETPKGRVKDTPSSNTQLANAIRELDPFDDTGYELLDAAHRRLKGSPLPKVNDPSEFARLRDSLADEIDADSLNLEAQRMDVDARKQAGKEAAEYFKGEKWGTVKDAPDPFVTVRQNKSGAYVEGRAVPMVSLERFTGGGEHIAADIVSAFDTRGWGDDVAVLPRSVLKERQYGRGENRATGIRLSEMGTRYTPDQIRNGEAKLEEVYIPQGWMKEYVRNARFRANELEYPKETLIYDDPGVISAARKDVAEVREILGIDPYQKTVVTDKELMAAAKEHNAYEVMSDVQAGKTASASEQQSMAVEFQRLRNEMRAAKEADEIDKYRDLWEKAGNLADALDKVGSEAGRTMRARRLIVDDAFDTFGLTRAIENAQDGKPLTARQQVNVENLVKDADRIRKELAKAQKELDDIRAGGEIQARAKRAPRFSRQELDDELESLLTQFKAGVSKASSGIDPELIPIVGKIALNYAKRGINTIDEIVEAIQGHIPNISRQEVIDAIAMPGEPRTKSDIAKALSELRTEAKRLSTPTQAKKATAAENMAAKKAESQRLAGIKRDRIEAERLERAGRRAEAKALRDDIASRAKGEKKAQDAQEALERGNAADLKRKADRVRDVQKKIAEYERRIAEGDYTMPSKDVAVKTKQVEFLEADMARMRKRFESLRESARLNESIPSKVIRTTADTLRGSQLGFDLGAMLRQGMFGIAHPKKMLVSVRNGFKAMRSDQVLQVIENRLAKGEINGKPASAIRSKAGLYMADTLSQPEETFASNLISKLPLLGKVYDAGERFTTGFLNTYRAEMFDWFAKRNPKATEQELKDWARWINSTSGRSNIKDIPRIASILFTSPRYAASRFEVMGRIVASPALLKNPAERQVLIEALKTGGVILSAMKMAEAAGADVNFDYKSSDFLKIRVGDTVYDPTAGISGSARLVLRSMFPAVNGNAPDRGKAVSDEVGRFATGKVSPALATPYEMRTNKSLTGFDVPEDEKGWNALLPVIVAQARENIKKDGYGKGLLKTAPEIVGIGSNTYPKK